MRMSPLRSISPLLLTLLATGCYSTSFGSRNLSREEAVQELQLAQADIEADNTTDGIKRLIDVRAVPSLPPDVRTETEDLLRITVEGVYAAGLDSFTSSEFLEYYDLELPETLRAKAGIYAAQKLFEEEHEVRAWKQVQKVDRKLPNHDARRLAGETLGNIGLWLIRNPGHYRLIFSYRNRGVAALEYLVIQFPLASQCPEAYVELAKYYEDDNDLDYAIERLEDLTIYHPQAPDAVEARARLPYLRLKRLTRDDYDRSELIIASGEVDRWLARNPDHELRSWVEELRVLTRKRLARNDLLLARYYEVVDSPTGARLHAERALITAEEVGAEEEVTRARAILAGLPSDRPTVEVLGVEEGP